MKWIEVSLVVDGEAAEAIADLLARYGHQGVSIEQNGIMPESWDDGDAPPIESLTVRAYLPADERLEDAQLQLETALGHMSLMYPMPRPAYRTVDEEDWANAWKAHYHPVSIGQRIVIRPIWVQMELAPDDVELALDPGMAFGTGTHPTTQLCLLGLEENMKPGLRVLDLGTGSGILAIAAAKLGAAEVLGLDNDPVAIPVAQQNIDQNRVTNKITVQTGSLESVLHSARRFDLVVVNILARIIIEMCGQGLGQTVRPGGWAMFSGIIDEQADDVEDALRRTGLEPRYRRNLNDWVLIVAYRPGHDD
ncbi:MAG: 50S ribosomal protein L11 methyltransferase [bacterium]|nr:50S ribosomal protein L11 methyltransferase [bacterium]